MKRSDSEAKQKKNTKTHGGTDAIKRLFTATDDGSEKLAMSLKLFGKGGADLIPLLNEGRVKIEELQKVSFDAIVLNCIQSFDATIQVYKSLTLNDERIDVETMPYV